MKPNRRQAGQSLIEFALLIPLMFLLVLGLFDIGRAIFYYAVMNNAAREGSRFAVVQPDCDYHSNPGDCSGGYVDAYPLDCSNAGSAANVSICSQIEEMLFNINEISSSTITIDHGLSSTNDPIIIVDIDFSYEPITPGISLMTNITIHANSQMLMTPIALP